MAQTYSDKVRDQVKSIMVRLEGTPLEQPIARANKTFLAGIGLADRMRSGFEVRFNELAADGEKARDRAKKSAAELREQVEHNAQTARKNVTQRINATYQKLLDYTPVATTADVEKLSRKLDKVLAQVAQ